MEGRWHPHILKDLLSAPWNVWGVDWESAKKGGWGLGRFHKVFLERTNPHREKKTLMVKLLKDQGKVKVSAGIFAVAAGTQQERRAEQTDWGLLSYWMRVTCGSYPTLAGISNRLSDIYVGSPDKLSQIPDPWLFHTERLIYLQILFILQRSRSSPPCCVQKQFMETPAKKTNNKKWW